MTEQIADYVADLEKLLDASLELCKHIGTGMEPAPQSMSVTMAQQAVRKFRKAATHAAIVRAALTDGKVSES